MKHNYFIFTLLAGILLLSILPGGCQKGERIIERPDSGLRNSSTIEIDKIQLADMIMVKN